jgi:hypothetical protein
MVRLRYQAEIGIRILLGLGTFAFFMAKYWEHVETAVTALMRPGAK